MRNLAFGLLLLSGIALKAQDASKVFSATEIVWFGMDFTKAKFVGQFAQGSNTAIKQGTEMRDKYIPAWQGLIAGDQKKFNLAKTFHKDNIYFDMTSVEALNKKINDDSCMVYNPVKLDKSIIEEMIQKYNSEKKEGIGVVFIIENFNKNAELASLYVTFFDIATKKVLLSEYETAIPRGIGIRNFWAGAIKEILTVIDESHYKKWEKANEKGNKN